ncbi:MAG TPA: GMC family oxidoreductase [Kofleriaceae bacterium]|nr:GMC family oxidoreductase [Kofleriaceae bacterium]
MVAVPAQAFTARKTAGVHTRETVTRDTEVSCDVVIVGSGAGGSTLAAELSEAGLQVIVVEEGRYFSTRDFSADASSMIRALYRDGGASMAVGGPPILFQEGRTVGGSTVINGGMAWKTPERILDTWVKEHDLPALSAEGLAPYFERVERRLHVAEQSVDSVGKDNELLRVGAERKGWKVITNRRNQVHCPGSNNCAFGCPTGAKQSALVTYIPRALGFGAEIYSDVRISRVLLSGKRATGVTGHVITADGRPGARLTVRARMVALCCGAMQTPALMARSGIKSPSRMLGRNLSLHPNCKLVAVFDEDVRGWEGVHQAYQVREFQDEGMLFAAVNVPPSILAMSMPMYGSELSEVLKDYRRMVIAGLLVEDSVTGRVVSVRGRPTALYQLSEIDADCLVRGTARLAELLFAAGAKKIHLPFAGVGDLFGPDDIRCLLRKKIPRRHMEVLTVHIMGTARMGGDRSRAVCDPRGRVYDTEGLLVADASLFPTPIGVNPAETIFALSTFVAHHLIDDQKRALS